MWSFAHEEASRVPSNYCKFLAAAIKDACVNCHCSCARARASSSFGADDDALPANDFDYKHVIILEIQSRAMKAKLRPKDSLFMENLSWFLSPTSGKLLIVPKGEKTTDEEDKEEDADDEKETFFSVNSCFSHCSGESGILFRDFVKHSVLEEFCHCEGWPFGLGRKALMLPPLPSSPSDSWTWHKRNLSAAKPYSMVI
ncbi:hypothetical protein J5N97_002180 [Dioscorea zingiberensis]|uniref:Uncharacterized protein n=1 Tax=Dioscorea zingiberensis TaxID=325984 RepID=A0A9D5HP46_9LILI|nr:hypothetical protein J5N97_002180 [Dioscorea zingiberensis]